MTLTQTKNHKKRTMKRQEIINKVNEVMAKYGEIAADYIEPGDNYDELGADSMKCLEALIEIEGEFVINIPGSELINVRTMQDVYDIVERKIKDTHGFQVY